MRTLFAFLLLGLSSVAGLTDAQEPTVTPSPSQSAPAPAAGRKDSSSDGNKSKARPGYLLTGTIFTEKAMAFPGVRLQIRRAGEKKFRWETYTNSRGEFALRVPEGQEYEVVVKEKNYKEMALKFKANSGELEQRLSLRLETLNQEKEVSKK